MRQAIGDDYLLADRTTLAFKITAPHRLDVAVLESKPSGDVDELTRVVSVYKGELLPGFYQDWVLRERERLQSLFERRMQALLDGLIAGGRWRPVQTWVERWIALGHVPEPAYRALMTAHAALGDQAGMATSYRRCLQALEEELGVAPSPETQALYEQLSEGDDSLVRPRRPVPQVEVADDEVLAPVMASESALPTYATPFVVRQDELAEIGRLLKEEPDCRLLTLVGPGGVGKTRLALAVASELVDAFPQGIYFVSLLPVSEAEFIVSAVAEVLNFSLSGGMDPKLQLLNHLRGRKLLLVLDNLEHLLPTPLPHQGG